MKRGNDEEKSMEPMFPRLHVNDTERGGPRAPPRNKMALYEQLSIPSQKFNSEMSMANQGSNNKLNPPLSSQASPSVHRVKEPTRIADLNPSLVRTGPENRQEEDFTVPSFMQNNHFRDIGSRDSSVRVGNIPQDGQRSPCVRSNVVESRDDARRSLQTETQDRGDEESEKSMVDSMSGTDLSPDDVVGIIGQKHFWKARRAIVNQQRVFAVQVFELHRLIKVQKLIAESPHFLLEESFVGRPLKGSPQKKDVSDAVVKTTRKIVNCIDVLDKPDTRVESSAENAVEKTSMSFSEKSGQPMNYGSFMGNPPPIPAVSDTNVGPWGPNQPSGHQWLIPVMTLSEGLVYKPYPVPGFMNPTYGTPGSTPIMGNYPSYGVPPPQYPYQGLGPTSFPHPTGHGYFPPFGMPVMHPPFVGSMEHMDHYNAQNQSSCSVSGQNNGHNPKAMNLNPSKHVDVQLSTASSPSVRIQRSIIHNEERSDALPLFPTSPVTNAGVDRSTRVIKVVPHNARSASESVARIFQSIQEERKQHDDV